MRLESDPVRRRAPFATKLVLCFLLWTLGPGCAAAQLSARSKSIWWHFRPIKSGFGELRSTFELLGRGQGWSTLGDTFQRLTKRSGAAAGHGIFSFAGFRETFHLLR